jgi:S1-C subfamily serine protease
MRHLVHDQPMFPIMLVGLALIAVACSGDGGPSALDLAPSVARVSGSACDRTVEGTAVLISDGLYLTSAHVVAGAGPDLQVRVPGGSDMAAVVVGFDANRDLALMKVLGGTGVPLRLGSAGVGDVGAVASVTSNLEVELIQYEVIRGITATGEDIYGEDGAERRAVEVAANVKPGVSGSALVNGDGEVVGLVFAESRTRESTYAVDASEIESFMTEVDSDTVADPSRCP